MAGKSKPTTKAIKPLAPKETKAIKGGDGRREGRLAANHNLTLLAIG